jgi:stage III sporulation protein AB
MSLLLIAKTVGSLMVIISSTMVGFAFSRRLTMRIEYIREIQSLLMELENEIHFMSRPLGQALLHYSQHKAGAISKFTRRIHEMEKQEDIGIDLAWQKAIIEFKDDWPIGQEEWSLLAQVGEVLGKTDRASQSSFIKMMCEKFNLQERKAEQERVLKEKLYRNLGVFGGIAIVLVLI